jgi:hypothetical protein
LTPAERKPTGYAAEGDIQIARILPDQSGDTVPADGTVLLEEVVVVGYRIHIFILRSTLAIGKPDSARQQRSCRRPLAPYA